MPANKRAACRQRLVSYSVCSAQFSLFPTFRDTIKRHGMDPFQPRTPALHTKEQAPHRKPIDATKYQSTGSLQLGAGNGF